MLRGRVNEQGEPLITVKLILNSVPTPLSAVIDTGFNGYLSVPKSIIARGFGAWRLSNGELPLALASVSPLDDSAAYPDGSCD